MPLRLDRRLLAVCLVACVIPFAFALYTGHAWEDYYITFRSSRNLATGHGLVFNHGDRLHTFTSPLGVLLPALASLLTLNSSDAGALWLFRGASIAAFAGAVALLWAALARWRYTRGAALALVAWQVTDLKMVDFSINGMETGFLLLFFAYSFWALAVEPGRRWRHLGAAWGGLMWTRPDSFIYIGALATAIVLFNRPTDTGVTRREWLVIYLRAAAVAAAVYLPWLLFSWAYFGSPVPHTIVAKATAGGPRSLSGLWHFLPKFPDRAWSSHGALEALFAPVYLVFGDWPPAILRVGRVTAAACALLWVVPWLRTETRAASLTLLAVVLYLTYYAPFIFPWYLCWPALLGLITLAGALNQLFVAAAAVSWRPVRVGLQCAGIGLVAVVVSGTGWYLWEGAKQLKAQQAVIEHGVRHRIGTWLHDHAHPGDTVLLEPLGYIGYYSGLKTFDVPGLSSREVVAVIRQHGYSWGHVAAALNPSWMVLRPHEVEGIRRTHPDVLKQYEAVLVCDEHAAVEQLPIHGRPYLAFDCRFTIFRRTATALAGPKP